MVHLKKPPHRFGTRNSCSLCGALAGVLLFPLAVIAAVIAFLLMVAMVVCFMPVFIVFILPLLVITKCRQPARSDVMKISEDTEMKVKEGSNLI